MITKKVLPVFFVCGQVCYCGCCKNFCKNCCKFGNGDQDDENEDEATRKKRMNFISRLMGDFFGYEASDGYIMRFNEANFDVCENDDIKKVFKDGGFSEDDIKQITSKFRSKAAEEAYKYGKLDDSSTRTVKDCGDRKATYACSADYKYIFVFFKDIKKNKEFLNFKEGSTKCINCYPEEIKKSFKEELKGEQTSFDSGFYCFTVECPKDDIAILKFFKKKE